MATRRNGEGHVLPPASRDNHTHTIVLLHGRNQSPSRLAAALHHSLDSRGRCLFDVFPSCRWVLAPTTPPWLPSTNDDDVGGAPASQLPQTQWRDDRGADSWFDVWNSNDLADHEDVQAPGLRNSVAYLRELLAHEACLLGGHWDDVVVMGFSQGAAVAVHTLLNLDLEAALAQALARAPDAAADLKPMVPQRHLGAVIGVSGRMPFPGRSLADTRAVLALPGVPADGNGAVVSATPVMLQHCADDSVARVETGRQLRDTLTGFGADVAWCEYGVGGHWFNSPQGIDDMVDFLEGRVGLEVGVDEEPDIDYSDQPDTP